jgi:selenocysteine-specific elongation factor
METDAIYDLILGTAGHIDHGKTSLVKALTGTDTDRLPEEKKRGITIELGYAHLELPPYRLGIVDVPGHEKFIRQMLAGATGMNLVMLTVAADDAIKPQTREHLDILGLLNLKGGVVVITKADLVEPDWLKLVEMEVRQFVEGTFLESVPLVTTSVKQGIGLDELRRAIHGQCQRLMKSEKKSLQTSFPFRMAIDRAFSIAGHGTVVTGSVASGRLHVGDVVDIMPSATPARVRGLQTHDRSVESVSQSQRAAINLAGVSLDEIERGHELSASAYLVPSTRMIVKVLVLERASAALKNRDRIRFHIGTSEILGSIQLFNTEQLEPGQTGLALVFLNECATAVWHQPFVIRQPSPMETLGGGTVIHSNPKTLKFRNLSEAEISLLTSLDSEDPVKRASAALYFFDNTEVESSDLVRIAGIIEHQPVFEQLKTDGELVEFPLTASRTSIVHQQHLKEIGNRVLVVLKRLHRSYPLRFAHPRHELQTEFAYLDCPQWLDLAIDRLKKERHVEANVRSISLVGSGPKLSKGQMQLMQHLVEQLRIAGMTPPSVAELQSSSAKNRESVTELLALAAENGNLARISEEFYLHAETFERIVQSIQQVLTEQHGLSTSALRQVLNTSRKYAIPILEHLDRIGITVRQGDLRTLANPVSSNL